MDTPTLIAIHKSLTASACDLMAAKNHDYAGADQQTPFANFELAEHLHLCRTSVGILIRLSDKLARMANFESARRTAVDESMADTVIDVINYAVLWYAAHDQHDGPPTAVPRADAVPCATAIPVGTANDPEYCQPPSQLKFDFDIPVTQ